jgi:hypothetical protein
MSDVSRTWSFFDHAAAIHRPSCESVRPGGADVPISEVDPAQVSESVIAYGMAARRVYDSLKRVIGQTGGLLILAETTGRRDVIDLPSLVSAEEALAEAQERLASLEAPLRLEAHRSQLQEAARLTAAGLAALRATRLAETAPDLGPALAALSRAYKILQRASESRLGLTMVDFRHACCTCGALTQ